MKYLALLFDAINNKFLITRGQATPTSWNYTFIEVQFNRLSKSDELAATTIQISHKSERWSIQFRFCTMFWFSAVADSFLRWIEFEIDVSQRWILELII